MNTSNIDDSYRVAQVNRFSLKSTSVCHDFIRILRECMEKWIMNRTMEVSKSYVYSKFFCEMRSSYCTYHNSSRAVKAHELITVIFAKHFPFSIHFLTQIYRHFDHIAQAWLPSCPRFLAMREDKANTSVVTAY